MATLNPVLLGDREKLRRLFRIKRVEGEMMLARGFILNEIYMMRADRSFVQLDLSGLQNISLTLEMLLQFRQQIGLFQTRTEFSCIYVDADKTKQVLVIYLENDSGTKVNEKQFEIVKYFIALNRFNHVIIITETGLRKDANKYIRTTAGVKIEVFVDRELAFNVTKHALTPISIKHIPARDVPSWAQQEGFQPEKLPMLTTADPIAKFYSAMPLDCFQYEVMGVTTDSSGFYRIMRLPIIEPKIKTKSK